MGQYVMYLLLLVISLELNFQGIISPLIPGILINIPIYSYFTHKAIMILRSFTYYRLFHKRLGWTNEIFTESWIGILFTPILSIITFTYGVLIALSTLYAMKFMLLLSTFIVMYQLNQTL